MDDLYRELIIDRYKNPQMQGNLDLTEAVFSGEGCAISLASADLLLESIIGKSLDEIKQVSKEDLLEMLGIKLGPVRLKCALLSLKVLKAGVYGLEELDEELARM